MTSADEHFLAGLSLHKAGRAAEAEAAYRAALTVEANHFTALQHLGALLSDRGATVEAAELFGKASRLKPSDPVIFYQLATTLAGLGRYDEALTAFGAAIALKSDVPLLHSGKACMLHAMGFASTTRPVSKSMMISPSLAVSKMLRYCHSFSFP